MAAGANARRWNEKKEKRNTRKKRKIHGEFRESQSERDNARHYSISVKCILTDSTVDRWVCPLKKKDRKKRKFFRICENARLRRIRDGSVSVRSRIISPFVRATRKRSLRFSLCPLQLVALLSREAARIALLHPCVQ